MFWFKRDFDQLSPVPGFGICLYCDRPVLKCNNVRFQAKKMKSLMKENRNRVRILLNQVKNLMPHIETPEGPSFSMGFKHETRETCAKVGEILKMADVLCDENDEIDSELNNLELCNSDIEDEACHEDSECECECEHLTENSTAC